jgi:1,4-alpha-glucan branching enzyme
MTATPSAGPSYRIWPGATREQKGRELIKVAKPSRAGTVRVTFVLPAAEPAGAVSVVGDFNDWNPFAHPLRKRSNGTRTAVITVPVGTTLRFRYLAEGGIWFDDDTAATRDAEGATITV